MTKYIFYHFKFEEITLIQTSKMFPKNHNIMCLL